MNPAFLTALRAANVARLPNFKDRTGRPCHREADGLDWTLSQWASAVVGELGEAANLIKKIERGDMSLDAARDDLGAELADVQTYLDIFAFRLSIDLDTAQQNAVHRGDMLMAATVERHSKLPLSHVAAVLAYRVGEAAGHVAAAELQLVALNPDIAARAVGRAQVTLECLAYRAGIDLEAATRAKWNAVSERIGYAGRLS